MAEPKLRPKGMGLGAEKVHLNKDSTPTTAGNPEKEDLTVKIGAFAIVNRGSKKGYYGQVCMGFKSLSLFFSVYLCLCLMCKIMIVFLIFVSLDI